MMKRTRATNLKTRAPVRELTVEQFDSASRIPSRSVRAVERPLNVVRRPRPAGSIGIAEAVRRAINSEHYIGSRSPEAVRSWVRRVAGRVDDTRGAVVSEGKIWLHPSMHAAFSELPRKDVRSASLASLPDGKRNRALAKTRAVRDFAEFLRGEGGELGTVEARKHFVETRATRYTYRDGSTEHMLPLSARSLERWDRLYCDGGADALARDGRGRQSFETVSEDAAALYWTLRNDPRKFKIAYCFRHVAFESERNRWRWFATLSACRKWDMRTRNERALLFNREGNHRYTQRAGT